MTPFTIGHVTAAPGTVASGVLPVAGHHGEAGTIVPISIVHGRTPGPVLLLTAGVHGMEYAPIVALQRMRESIDPATLRGTIVMVHVANMPSFLGRTIYYSPIDGKNLNRVFPGTASGTISDRIAEVITREVIAKATHVLDLHGGDGNESLRPYSYWVATGAPAVAEDSRAMALAFGLDHIVVDYDRPTNPAESMYLSNTAITRGKPAVTTECGCLGEVSDDAIALIERGVAGVMRHLGMHDSGPPPVAKPMWVIKDRVLRASATGIFIPAVRREQHVRQGALIGKITDFHGHVLEEIPAPFDGEVLYVIATPPVSEGEPIAMVGHLSQSFERTE
jgi:predicted deacylase